MKNIISLLTIAIVLFTACKKENNTPAGTSETLPVGTTIATGSVASNAHASSGTVKIIKNATNKVYLVFENFKTDNGPDLKVWLSPNNTASPYQEVGVLKAVSGNFYYELNASFNYATNNRVLIWCKQFSVLFGYAVLQ